MCVALRSYILPGVEEEKFVALSLLHEHGWMIPAGENYGSPKAWLSLSSTPTNLSCNTLLLLVTLKLQFPLQCPLCLLLCCPIAKGKLDPLNGLVISVVI